MGSRPAERVSALRLQAPVQFRDRWQGRLAEIDVDEDWEVLNLVVRRGILRWSAGVKLPFSAALTWSEDRVTFDCTSRQAFAREIPPVAAPARPLSVETPLSVPGARLAGLLLVPVPRRATAILISRGLGRKHRVPIADVSFEGKLLRVATHAQALPAYLSDDELAERARDLLITSGALSGQERRTVSVSASGGVVEVSGNARTRQTRERVERLMTRLQSDADVRVELIDDIELELAVGRALERSGLPHGAEVYARSLLGEVTLLGHAPAVSIVEDISRTVSRVPGVRGVKSLVRVEPGVAAAT